MTTTETSARTVLDEQALENKIAELGDALAEIADPADAVLIGIRTRGAVLADRLQRYLSERRGLDLPVGAVDITLYRDDLSQLAEQPLLKKTEIDFDLEGRQVLLIDDVLYTGRTIRCAIDAILEFGRPRAIKLGVLVDRGHRELPIQPDVAAITIDTTKAQIVKVCLRESDDREAVILSTLAQD